MLDLITTLASGLTIVLAILLAAGSTGIRNYVEGMLEVGRKVPILSDEQVAEVMKWWKRINRGLWTFVVFVVALTVLNMYNPPQPPSLESKMQNIEKVKPSVTPPPVQSVVRPKLDQQIFYYCLDKAATKKDGLSADVINACKEAALNVVVPTSVEKTAGYI